MVSELLVLIESLYSNLFDVQIDDYMMIHNISVVKGV